ncbi:hypothetical protein F4808DRAFT_476208 [Astrocystis sublimbata]|nr:hypothetical protein F4808DRAFT_476208 [Astrocystis sublimbata]
MFLKLPVPSRTFSGKVVIVTGANSGLGLEAVSHIVRLDATKVTLAVRDQKKCIAFKESIIESTGKPESIIDVYFLSKLLQLLAFQELSEAVSNSSKPGDVVAKMVKPGSVHTALDREGHGPGTMVWTAFVGCCRTNGRRGFKNTCA